MKGTIQRLHVTKEYHEAVSRIKVVLERFVKLNNPTTALARFGGDQDFTRPSAHSIVEVWWSNH